MEQLTPHNWLPKSGRRSGVTSLEIVVAAGIILATVTLLTTLSFKCGMIWRDISTHRLAIAELSGHLEQLTLLDRDEAKVQLENLEPSKLCQQRLRDAKISSSMTDDNLGVRIQLNLDWDRGHESKPVSLSGWLVKEEADR